jgi:hypothetical protein
MAGCKFCSSVFIMTNDGRLLIDITLPADYREIQELFYQVKRDGEGESPPRLKGESNALSGFIQCDISSS